LDTSEYKTPNRCRPGAKKRHGSDSPVHGVGYSVLSVLIAADHRRDWLPGGGCNVAKFVEFHQLESL
jgi:hypothetical protein